MYSCDDEQVQKHTAARLIFLTHVEKQLIRGGGAEGEKVHVLLVRSQRKLSHFSFGDLCCL